MKRFSEQLKKKADTIRLSTQERRDLRERIVAYMEYHPRAVKLLDKSAAREVVSTRLELKKINFWKVLPWSGAVFGVFFFTLVMLAERTVPGDMLYAVKVGFNEELRSTLAFTPYEKIVWETERLNRRIAEARVLADKGELTEKVEAEVAAAVLTHSENARKEIALLKQTDKDGAVLAALQFNTVVEMQVTALQQATGGAAAEAAVASPIKIALSGLSIASEDATEAATLPAYDRLMARVEQDSMRAHELLLTINEIITTEEQADIKRRLEDIDRSVAVAMSKASEDELVARAELVSVLQRTQRLIVFMTNIDVRRTLTVEEIVPVARTAEERNKAVQTTASEIMRLVELAEAEMATTTVEASLLEKLLPALAEGKTIASTSLANTAFTEEELPSVEQQVSYALVLVTDVVVALGLNPNKAQETVEVVNPDSPVETLPSAPTTTDAVSDIEKETPDNNDTTPTTTPADLVSDTNPPIVTEPTI